MITIEKADTRDYRDIQAVARVAFPATYAEILTEGQLAYMMEWMYSTESLLRQMQEEGTHLLHRTRRSGHAGGYVSIRPDGEGVFHLEKIYVLPGRQGEHIGRKLFERAVRAVKEMHPGPCRLELNVNRSNPARGFYERMGMRKLREGDFPHRRGILHE